ncbi:MAG: GntR family transcriptional regulator [Planctomycetaceae bacterium]|nr:GntR family transcriptional regulator [Planctomycetaceae bacterium]
MNIQVNIVLGSDVPIYRQIVEQVKHAVATGALSEGDTLPSIRALANRLVVNHNTVAKAYNLLVQDGIARSEKGRGLFITAPRNLYSQEELRRRFDEAADRFVGDVLMLGFKKSEIVAAIQSRLAEVTILKD